jgi:hypothetical protein
MSHKKLVLFFFVSIIVFLGGNFLIWKLWTEDILTKKYDGGDLARTSYIAASKYHRKNAVDLPRRHFPLDLVRHRDRKVDILTLGDSFSFGMGEGKNHFYQDYLATCSDAEVANVFAYPTADMVMFFSPLTNLLLLYNSGVLDEVKPKYVVLESVERYCIERYARPYDFKISEPREKLAQYYKDNRYTFDYLPDVSFVNTGNVKYLWSKLLYQFSDHAFSNAGYAVICRKLKTPMFSENGDHILFLKQDVKNAKLVTDQSVAMMNDNLNRMAELLEKKNIKLVFMPIVDKYDLYSEYIADNPYPKNTFFDKLRPLPKKYQFIDTKKLLKEEVDRGVKDVFYPDESHWSWKAPEKIFRSVLLK